LYFLDYETLSSVIPAFDGLSPYQQVPFQYSIHILDAPGSALRQVGYLHQTGTNPAEPLTDALVRDIGRCGSVVVWNQSFEMSCNDLLGRLVPQHAAALGQINERVVDLMVPFWNGWYIDAGFLGRASIKNVLPVLVPELSYKTLGIQEGAGAQRLWMEAVISGQRAGQKAQILADLEEYCGLDTLAMVEIYQVLCKLPASVNKP
jgi:hypothetical protein